MEGGGLSEHGSQQVSQCLLAVDCRLVSLLAVGKSRRSGREGRRDPYIELVPCLEYCPCDKGLVLGLGKHADIDHSPEIQCD